MADNESIDNSSYIRTDFKGHKLGISCHSQNLNPLIFLKQLKTFYAQFCSPKIFVHSQNF